ncbi:hypothetical protein DFH09DRAFT_467919 [Mycena vulgaris]|nr:hypothetical protein DFH09DRAFT_467919 [Mycena vulgaris]
MTCFKCGLEGHMARNCTHNNAPSGGGGVSVKPCYKCGVVGHIARDCAKQIKCYNCSETGHISRHCPHPQTCHLCKKEGCVRPLLSLSSSSIVLCRHEQMECPDKFILDTEVIEYFLKLTRNISAVRTT